MKNLSAIVIIALVFLTIGVSAHADNLIGDSSNGETLFDHQCGACHSMTANRVGPMLNGVYGRKAGTVPGFTYSNAVKSSGVTWDATSIDKWLTTPRGFIPGQRMNFNISDPQKRADIIAYLKTSSEPGNGKK
jgi:cytochrome c